MSSNTRELRTSRAKAASPSNSDKRKQKHSIETNNSTSPSDSERLQRVLEKLNIRFTNCTFTYKLSHFESATPQKKRSTLSSLTKKISGTLGKVREMVLDEQAYNKCLFVPVNEKDKVKSFLLASCSSMELSFENCKFIKRSSTITEKVKMRLRRFFGVVFELEYINASATIDKYKFRAKDIPAVYQYIQERVAEDG